LNVWYVRNMYVLIRVQANANREILKIVYKKGLSVVVVSGFEMRLALDTGFPGSRIFFNGNGKQEWEMT
jgi:diaminopimelate decarboxylase